MRVVTMGDMCGPCSGMGSVLPSIPTPKSIQNRIDALDSQWGSLASDVVRFINANQPFPGNPHEGEVRGFRQDDANWAKFRDSGISLQMVSAVNTDNQLDDWQNRLVGWDAKLRGFMKVSSPPPPQVSSGSPLGSIPWTPILWVAGLSLVAYMAGPFLRQLSPGTFTGRKRIRT